MYYCLMRARRKRGHTQVFQCDLEVPGTLPTQKIDISSRCAWLSVSAMSIKGPFFYLKSRL